MPITSALQYIKTLLSGLPMPGGAANLAAYIIPPDPNVETDIPTAYVWFPQGDESRDGPAGTMPRNTGPGTFSGDKTILHDIDIFLTWFGADDDPKADSLFPGMVDAVMKALRTAVPNPAPVTDPWTEEVTQIADTGEKMKYRSEVRAVADQRYLRFDALITLQLTEVISA